MLVDLTAAPAPDMLPAERSTVADEARQAGGGPDVPTTARTTPPTAPGGSSRSSPTLRIARSRESCWLPPEFPGEKGPQGDDYGCVCDSCAAAFLKMHPEAPGRPEFVGFRLRRVTTRPTPRSTTSGWAFASPR